jgi:hypothetical protein
MKWKDKQTLKLFEWVAKGFKVPVESVKAVLIEKTVGKTLFVKRINPQDDFPTDFKDHHHVYGVILVDGTVDFLTAVDGGGEKKKNKRRFAENTAAS